MHIQLDILFCIDFNPLFKSFREYSFYVSLSFIRLYVNSILIPITIRNFVNVNTFISLFC